MKKTIKTTAIVFAGMVITMALAVTSCKKDGKTGPAGPAGAPGATGNANVQQFDFGSMTVGATTAATYTNSAITAGLLDSSAIMVYYSQYAGQWNVAGGCGPGCSYQTIVYTDGSGTPSVNVYLEGGDGGAYTGSDITWLQSRVLIIKANVFRMAHADASVDLNNYESVKRYFKLNK